MPNPTEFGIAGRIVWSHPHTEQPVTDNDGNPRIGKDGKPRTAYMFALAVPTEEFNAKAWPHMYAEAATLFGANVHQMANFAWKTKRDTDLDSKQRPYSEHPGRAGCVTMTFSTEAGPPKLFKMENGAYYEIPATAIKCGDFVYVNVSCKANKPDNPTHKPGLYMNPNGVLLIGIGDAIVSSINPQTAFAGYTGQLPAGATAIGAAPPTPAAATGFAPGPAAAPMAAPSPGGSGMMPGPNGAPAAAPMAAPAPNHGFVAGATGAPMPGMSAGVPMPPGR